ncbi:MAG: glutamine--fructose-6-phosphate transaminase (isomerizing), partial [Acidobacteriota bacterium]|nr:glutamine--fructose-6-phosphate transaminase (isomerizing) [Acidobacteriota bacterium]
MCGIVGYIGNRNATSVLINSLKKLEYRGYDSAGIAVIGRKGLELARCKGKISNLEQLIEGRKLTGKIGLGHTRWATHGRPSEENAHPHTDCEGKIVIVHNGIIENYLSLKKSLKSEGHVFKSETDTEVIAHLVEKYFLKTCSLLSSVQEVVKRIEGSYAIGVISSDEPENIVAARKDSPLIIGLGKGEYFIASDIPAVLDYTKKVIYMENGETAVINRGGVSVYDSEGKPAKKKIFTVEWNPVMAEKGGFKHFMLKEIFEQPRAIQNTFRSRADLESGKVYLDGLNLTINKIKSVQKIFLIACGTAYHAGLIGKFLLEELAKIPCEVDIASEFRYRDPILDEKTLAVIITQSGETADTLAALREARLKGASTLAVCNVLGSTVTREVESMIYTHAGPEIGVASTKAFTTQLTALCLLAIYLGRARKTLEEEKAKNIILHLLRIPKQVKEILESEDLISSSIKKYFKKEHFLYLGRGINYPIALEGALKLKEISYIHAEGYPAGEMKHGPIALIDENMPVVTVATDSKVYNKVTANIEEVRSRDGIVIALANKGNKE